MEALDEYSECHLLSMVRKTISLARQPRTNPAGRRGTWGAGLHPLRALRLETHTQDVVTHVFTLSVHR